MMTGTKKKFTGAIVLVAALMVTLILGSMTAFAAKTSINVHFEEITAGNIDDFFAGFSYDADNSLITCKDDFIGFSRNDVDSLAAEIKPGFNSVVLREISVYRNPDGSTKLIFTGRLIQEGGGNCDMEFTESEIRENADAYTFYYPSLGYAYTQEEIASIKKSSDIGTRYILHEVPADEMETFADAFSSSALSTGYKVKFASITEDEALELAFVNGIPTGDNEPIIIYNIEDYGEDGVSYYCGSGYSFEIKGDNVIVYTDGCDGSDVTENENYANKTFYIPVLRSDSTGEDNQETAAASSGNEYTLTRTVESNDTPYTWTIPTAIDWTAVGGEGNEGLYKCSVDFKIAPSSGEAYIILEDGKSLQLTVSSGNGWKLKGTNNNELAYTATKDGASTAIANGDAIFDVASGSNDASGQTVKVNFATTDAAKIADTYTDTLTFTSDIVATAADETAAEPEATEDENESTPIVSEPEPYGSEG